MRTVWTMCTTRATLCAALALATGTLGASTQAPSKRLTIDRAYSLPRLIGTAPRGAAWAADGRRFAFLWNDEGTNFYDVWVASTDNLAPVRVTRMPRLTLLPAPADDAPARRQRDARVEGDSGVGSVAWHPDGRRLVFDMRGDIFVVIPGSEPRRIHDGTLASRALQLSPDGRTVAYIAGGDLWLASIDVDREPHRLTELALDDVVSVERFEWSPDGASIVLVETDVRRVPERLIPDYLLEETEAPLIRRPFPGEEAPSRRVGVVAAAGGAVRWIDRGRDRQDPIFSFRWSPDSQSILLDTSDLYVKDRRLLVAAAASGSARMLYREQEPENVSAEWDADWAPDGSGVYFTSDRGENYHVHFAPLDGTAPRAVTKGPWAVSQMHVSGAAKAVFVVGNEGRPEERQLLRVGFDGARMARVSVRPGTHTPVVSPDGRHALVTFSSDETPFDLFLTRLDPAVPASERERRITTSPLPEFRDYDWTKPQYVTFQSQVDGATLHGRLTLPRNLDRTKKYPAILGSVYTNTVRNQWGGRTAHPTWGLDQFLVQEGYVILTVNMRGSSGHGKAFRRGIRLDYGGIDVDDVASGVEYLKTLGFVDSGRVGIWGSSYGGLMTTMSLFRKPGVYAAGIAGAPATNVFHALTGEMRVMMRPQEQQKEYAEASSFRYASGLQDPLMIIHGMRDRVVLFKDSVTLVQRLIALDNDVDFVVMPDAEHGWDLGPLYETRFAFKKMIDHFDRHLGRGPR
jgi:dipeptidyl-peptidase-4